MNCGIKMIAERGKRKVTKIYNFGVEIAKRKKKRDLREAGKGEVLG